MFSFSRKRSAILRGVVIDIGSGSVGASIIVSDATKKLPEILYTYREFMPVRRSHAAKERMHAMRQALSSVLLQLSQRGMSVLEGRGPVNRLLVSCTAPWTHTVTRMIHYEREQPFAITHKLVTDIIKHAQEKEEEVHETHKESIAHFGVQVIEQSVVSILLNGYPIEDPYGKQAEEIDIAHLRGLVPTDVLETIKDVTQHTLAEVPTTIHTSALMLYCVLRDIHPKMHDALIVEVSGEATECSIMQNDILYETAHVEYGMSSLTRAIAEKSKTIPEEARTYLRSYKQDALSDAHEKLLLLVQQQYAAHVGEALDILSERYPLPKTVFLVIDQSMQPFFVDALHSALAKKGGVQEKTIVPITPASVYKFAETQKGVDIDPRLAISARFFHKLHACGEMDN